MAQLYNASFPVQESSIAWLNCPSQLLPKLMLGEILNNCDPEFDEVLGGDQSSSEACDDLIPTIHTVTEESLQTWLRFSSISLPFTAQDLDGTLIGGGDHTLPTSQTDGGNNLWSPPHSSPIWSTGLLLEGSLAPIIPRSFQGDSEADTGLKMELSTPKSMQSASDDKSVYKPWLFESRLQRRRERNRISQRRYRNKKDALIVAAENHVLELEKTVQHRLQQINEEERKIADLNKRMSVLRAQAFSRSPLALLNLQI